MHDTPASSDENPTESRGSESAAVTMPEYLGHYRILRELGAGGMGVVYLALDEQLKRHVAVKILPAEMSLRQESRDRFGREAEAISRLDHPCIVPIYEMGTDRGIHYYVMRFVDGVPLHEYAATLRRPAHSEVSRIETVRDPETETQRMGGPDAPKTSATTSESPENLDTAIAVDVVPRLLELFEKVAEAFDYAHEHGIIHRDIKPSNIMVDTEGRPQVLDFGLAKFTDAESLTSAGHVMGTIPYMAPEQVTFDKAATDRRTDLYSLGVTMYECFCGVRPFTGASREGLIFMIIMKDPPPLSSHVPNISKDIETVTLKCLEKDPARRYATCRELASDLQRIRQHRQIEARPVGRLGKIVRWAERNPLVAILSAILVVAAVVIPTILVSNWVTQRRYETYRYFVGEASRLEERRDAARADLVGARVLLTKLESEIPPWSALDSEDKGRLFAARRRVEFLEDTVRRTQAEIEYALARSREPADPIDDAGERARLYFALFLEAEEAGDRERIAALELLLKGTEMESRLAARGALTLRTSPEGARARMVRLVTDPRGLLVPDERSLIDLGTTPCSRDDIPAGSWICTFELEGRATVTYPVKIERDQHWGDAAGWHDGRFAEEDWTIRLPEAESFDAERFAYVPAGPWLTNKNEFETVLTPALEWRWCNSYLIARHEVTMAEYFAFLDDPTTRDLILEDIDASRTSGASMMVRYVPRVSAVNNVMFNVSLDDGSVLPPHQDSAFSMKGAVLGVSQKDAERFAEWSSKSGEKLRLPTAQEWEKSARGVDGRLHVWGAAFDWALANSYRSQPPTLTRPFAREPGAFPTDRSVYGVFDLAGNVAEWSSTGPTATEAAGLVWYCGGAFGWADRRFYVTWPSNCAGYDYADNFTGIRLARSLDP